MHTSFQLSVKRDTQDHYHSLALVLMIQTKEYLANPEAFAAAAPAAASADAPAAAGEKAEEKKEEEEEASDDDMGFGLFD
jgi:ribosomal protein L12E/L44/L45/RPP1/RPP2